MLYGLILSPQKGTLLKVLTDFNVLHRFEAFLNYLLFLSYCCVNSILILIAIITFENAVFKFDPTNLKSENVVSAKVKNYCRPEDGYPASNHKHQTAIVMPNFPLRKHSNLLNLISPTSKPTLYHVAIPNDVSLLSISREAKPRGGSATYDKTNFG